MKSEINKEIGQRIKAYYTEGGGKQSALKDIIGTKHNSTISAIVNGDRTLRPDELEKIADDMGVTIDYLITGHEKHYTDNMFFNDNAIETRERFGPFGDRELDDQDKELLNLIQKLSPGKKELAKIVLKDMAKPD